jgi:hypothetical protein
MPTEQIELTTEQTESTTAQTDLIEKLTCLEFEAAQLNRAYQLWSSLVEQGKAPDWMAAATRITYDGLIAFYLEVSAILADVPQAFSASPLAQLWGPRAEPSPELLPMTQPDCSGQTELTTEQTELIEKLNCLEFETSQLNRAYELWRPYVEQGTVPDWMAAAIRISYDALITFCLEVSTILAEGPRVFSATRLARLKAAPCEISGIGGEEGTTAYPKLLNNGAARGPRAEPSPELLLMTEPDWSRPEMPAAISPFGNAISEQPNSHQGEQEEEVDVPQAFSARLMAQLKSAACETSGILGEKSTTAHLKLRSNGAVRGPHAEPSSELLPMTEPDWQGPEMPAAVSPFFTSDTMAEQPAFQQGQLEEQSTTGELSSELLPMTEPDWSAPEMPAAISPFFTRDTVAEQANIQLGWQEQESIAAELPPELLPMTESDWSAPEMPVAIAPPSTGDAFSDQPDIQPGQLEEEAGAEPATTPSLATLAKWLQGSSSGILFFIPPGTMGRLLKVTTVAIVIVAVGMIGIYRVRAQHAAPRPAILGVKNSAAQGGAVVVAIPTSDKAAFKFDPDLVAARLGRSFVLNAVLSRGSDIGSVAVQIDYDANLLQFMGVSEGGFLVKDGQKVVLAQRNDPLTGVLRISAEKPLGTPGISGDGPVFALSFQARKKGKATVSIVPGAQDSQGRRIEIAGSQVSVKVN